MAKEAIEAVRDAELRAKQFLDDAAKASNVSRQEAERFADQEYQRILINAEVEARRIKDNALLEGELEAKPIIEKGIIVAKNITDLSKEMLESAVNIIIERIVNTNGNS